MNDELLRRVLPVGDLVDRLCINQIKAIKFAGQKKKEVEEEASYLREAICFFAGDVADSDEFRCFTAELMSILLNQWSVLDRLRDTNDEVERGRCAIQAQDLNVERVKLKNNINKLAGSFLEHKQYGTGSDSTISG